MHSPRTQREALPGLWAGVEGGGFEAPTPGMLEASYSLLTVSFFFSSLLQQGDCVISKVLTFDLTKYPDANPNPNEQ